ncbi:hypothetical protein CMV_009737 [Castanea mollissima]|uniref:Uncharacterized protein n=1 Tax=Castanea mollissima TaxID=60419 RepID=A0A8J4RBL8_9ROSI|nr:hypothetical protein CMV_009737 [Castanea mollissima]
MVGSSFSVFILHSSQLLQRGGQWSISVTSIADGRWHIVTMTIDADLGDATCFVDGGFDGHQTGLPLHVGNSIWEQGTEVWKKSVDF